MKSSYEQEWEKYWLTHEKSLFGKVSSFYRKNILSHYVKKVLDLYFLQSGYYVDCGSGSSESSMRLNASEKNYIAFDVSGNAVSRAIERFENIEGIVGDVFHLPFKDKSISGIYNLGVMEHFYENELTCILKEFSRVLKEDSYVVLFWPYQNGFSQVVLDSIGFFLTKVLRKKFWYTPSEITRLKSKAHARLLINNTGLLMERIHFSYGDFFTHYVVVAKKKA